jgi:hypothetical protein
VTYGNECDLKAKKVKLHYKGECYIAQHRRQ